MAAHNDANKTMNERLSVLFSSKALEGEVSRLSQSLESSLLEKGEIASRLNSTQDEVQQMRTGIEKLRARIELDERKKKKMGELLKGDSYILLKLHLVELSFM